MKATLALADDHILLRSGLASLLKELGYTVLFEAGNGRQVMQKLTASPLPQLILMDINMPVMDGFATTQWLKEHHPSIKVLALSMLDDEASVVKMIRSGARGFLLKDSEPEELDHAISSVLQKGFYHSEMVSGKLMMALSKGEEGIDGEEHQVLLSEKEQELLRWVCTDLSFKEIAGHMNVSPRTVDGYRDALFEKLEIKSRVGLALFAVRQGIVKP
jgi:DNA-binding NarL/FixJ family response regulator